MGVADCAKDPAKVPFEQVLVLMRRIYMLPNRPCGRWMAHVVQNWVHNDWPDDIIDALAWYATNDPDPDRELWRTESKSGRPYYGGDIHTAGINSVRGVMAGAIASLLFDNNRYFARLQARLIVWPVID